MLSRLPIVWILTFLLIALIAMPSYACHGGTSGRGRLIGRIFHRNHNRASCSTRTVTRSSASASASCSGGMCPR